MSEEDKARVQAAAREAEAALAIASDPAGPVEAARAHVDAGWHRLAEAERHEPIDAFEIGESLPWADAGALGRLRDGGDVLRAAADLAAAVDRARRDLGITPRAPPWRRAGLLGAAVVGLGIVALLAMRDDGEDGLWRGSYYPTPDFEGQAVERREGDVRFYWHMRAPIEGVPRDGFSARFETCLVLPDAVPEAAFQIGSDDGSRIAIDGDLVVDNWGAHRYRSRGAIRPLPAGAHRVMVEFFDREKEATLVLVASLDGGLPRPIPAVWLRFPAPDGSCEGVGD